MTSSAVRTALVAGSLLMVSCAAGHAETVTLKFAHQFPTTHFAVKIFISPYIKAVEKKSDGRIKFRVFPAEQLAKAKGILDAVKNRVTDVGFVGVTYVTEKMPLTSVVEIPGLFSDVKKGYRAYMALVTDRLAKLEYAPQNLQPLTVAMTPPYQIVLRKESALADIGELKGLKLRVPGNTGVLTAGALGAVPVKIAPGDLYLALERGTVDGTLLTSASVMSRKYYEVTKTITTNASLGTVAFVQFINKEVWASLPADLQTILSETGREVGLKAATILDAVVRKADKGVAAKGMTVVALKPEVVAQMNQRLGSVERKWLEQVGQRSEHAASVLREFKSLLASD